MIFRAALSLPIICVLYPQARSGDGLSQAVEQSELRSAVTASLEKLGIEPRQMDIAISTDGNHVRIEFDQFQGLKGPSEPERLPSVQNTYSDEAVDVVVDHLNQIKKDGIMSNKVSTSDYWQGVFYEKGKLDIFPAALPAIQKALNSGLQPYRDTGQVTADEFADLALQAVGRNTQPKK